MELDHTSSASIWGRVEYYVKVGLLPSTSDQSVKPLFLLRFASFDVLIYSTFKMQSQPREFQPLKLSVNLTQYKHPLFLGTVPMALSIVILLLQKWVKFVALFAQSAFLFVTSCLSLQLILRLSAGENTFT